MKLHKQSSFNLKLFNCPFLSQCKCPAEHGHKCSLGMMTIYTSLRGSCRLLLLGNENLRPAQRETEAGGKAWQDSTSLMPPRLRMWATLTALCSVISAWAGAEAVAAMASKCRKAMCESISDVRLCQRGRLSVTDCLEAW